VKLPKGDAVLLQLVAAFKLIEADPVQAREYERRLEEDIQAFEEWQRT
jgi:adenine C2-methylase RlmN of 23S rRNA A2503 and tRNA A37